MQDVKTITVDLKERSYPVFIGKGLLDKAGALLKTRLRGKAFIVSDENVAPLYLNRAAQALDAEIRGFGSQKPFYPPPVKTQNAGRPSKP